MGIYIFKSDSFFLLFVAGDIGQNGAGGHGHNDKLSFELRIGDNDIFLDPGTYLYTPIPMRRNEFRSVLAHNCPQIGVEQNELNGDNTTGLFRMKKLSESGIINFGKNYIEGYVKFGPYLIIRKLEIYPKFIKITDRSNHSFNYGHFNFYSSGYGKLSEKEKRPQKRGLN
jgi:hypothetical protein